MNADDVAYSDIVDLQRLLTAKALSSVELTQLYLDRSRRALRCRGPRSTRRV
jgi:hypothetical protein